jgi:hypothetical protein
MPRSLQRIIPRLRKAVIPRSRAIDAVIPRSGAIHAVIPRSGATRDPELDEGPVRGVRVRDPSLRSG